MEATPEHIAGLTHYLSQTLNPTTRKQAETALATVESQPNFPVLLLKLVEDPSTDPTVRFAGVIYFKNFVKRCWVQNGEQDVITAADRAAIKTHIVTLMRAVPASLQAQLGEAVSIIADNDFPDNWMNLIPDLTSKLSADDHVSNIGILQTAHSIFRRYRGMTRTDKLFLEIKLVLSTFAQPYLEFLKIVDQAIEANKDNGPVLQNLFQVLLQIVKIFYDLNYQDLPEFFEDHQSEFMVLFQKYLSYTNPLLSTGDDDEVGSLEKVKATICESLDLYAKKYAEEFTHLPDFVTVVWNLLTTTGLEPKNDILVSKAIGFLTSVVQPSQYRSLFQDPDTLRNICERVVLPNMQLRDSDEELFEDDPIEFIRRDLEGSDTNTRRRAASELVRGLLEHFASEVTGIFSQYVALNLQNYEKNPKSNWKSKDTALFLITSLSARSSTAQAGVTKVNEFMEVLPLFTQHILPELQTAANGASHPIITVDAIKFLMVFRSQLTKEQLSSVFPYLLNHLGSSNYVVYTYAAVCIERILATKLPNGAFQFHEGDIATVAYPILQHLLGLIERNGVTPEKLAENDYLMKTAMRITIVAKHDLEPNAIDIVKRLTQVIEIISKNPSNPKFNHYVFESLAATIRFICARKPQLVNDFEALLFPPFEAIISSGTDEFMPYVFQILSQMLTLHPSGSQLPPTYASMIQPLLMPALWNAHGNVPALVRLLRSYLEKTPGAFTEGTLLGQVLGVCHKLIGSRVDDHFGFELLQGVFEFIPMATIRQYLNNIFVLLFTRLSHAKTTKYTRGMLTFFSFLFVLEKTGLTADTVVGAVDSVQGQPLFNNLLEKVLIPELTSMLSIQERKMAVVGLSRCLKTSTIMRTPPYTNVSSLLANSIVAVFDTPPAEFGKRSEEEELYTFDIDETAGYHASYAKLMVLGSEKHEIGLLKTVGSTEPELQRWVGTCLGTDEQLIKMLSPENGNKLMQLQRVV